MQYVIENITPTETQKQQYLVAPPPSLARKRKSPGNCYSSFIDQIQGGLYSSSKLVRSQPRTTADSYFIVRTFKAEVRSYRRNYSHRSVALYRTKKEGSTRRNIEYMTCSFLELDGSTDNTIKTQGDVLTLISKNSLPTESSVIGTSNGNFHLIWDYNNPLPWTTKNESYWTAQQKRLIQLFKRDGFNVDVGASLNPTQNLRNPSQLRPFNFKRGCQVHIHKSYKKTSLRSLYKALNATNIPNPKPVPASVKLRRYLRQNKTFTLTHKELSINLGIALSTAERIVKRAIASGDMFAVGKVGNNKRIRRATRYTSKLYIEPQFSEPSHSISKNNAFKKTKLLKDFQANGTEKGRRNRTIFALGLEIKSQLGERASIAEIADQLRGGAVQSGLSEKELVRTIRNAIKPVYSNPFSLSKLQEWNLLEEPEHSRKSFLH